MKNKFFVSFVFIVTAFVLYSCKKEKTTGHLTVKVALNNSQVSPRDSMDIILLTGSAPNVNFLSESGYILNNQTADFGELNPGTYTVELLTSIYLTSCNCAFQPTQTFQIIVNQDKEIDLTH